MEAAARAARHKSAWSLKFVSVPFNGLAQLMQKDRRQVGASAGLKQQIGRVDIMTSAHFYRATAVVLAASLALGHGDSAAAETGRRTAGTTSTAAVAAAATKRPDHPAGTLICVRDRVNSRVLRNYCHTAAQWESRGGLISE